jgi:hypothetical protein
MFKQKVAGKGKIVRGFRLASVSVDLVGLIILLSGPAVFVDTFTHQNPLTFWMTLSPLLILSLVYAVIPASLVSLVGWLIARFRNRN